MYLKRKRENNSKDNVTFQDVCLKDTSLTGCKHVPLNLIIQLLCLFSITAVEVQRIYVVCNFIGDVTIGEGCNQGHL